MADSEAKAMANEEQDRKAHKIMAEYGMLDDSNAGDES
jgi:hypothetical protein